MLPWSSHHFCSWRTCRWNWCPFADEAKIRIAVTPRWPFSVNGTRPHCVSKVGIKCMAVVCPKVILHHSILDHQGFWHPTSTWTHLGLHPGRAAGEPKKTFKNMPGSWVYIQLLFDCWWSMITSLRAGVQSPIHDIHSFRRRLTASDSDKLSTSYKWVDLPSPH